MSGRHKNVFLLYLKQNQQVQKNRHTALEGVIIDGKRTYIWGLPEYGRYGENTKLKNVWKKLIKGCYLIIYDEKEGRLYLTDIDNIKDSKELSEQVWNTRKYNLIFTFNEPIEFDNDELLQFVRKAIEEDGITLREVKLPVTEEDIIDIYSMDTTFSKEIFRLISLHGQMILYGPPGTGKTYMAGEVGKMLILEKLPCEFFVSKLDEVWDEFVSFIDGRIFETLDKGTKFQITKNSRNNLTVKLHTESGTEYSLTEDKIKEILRGSNCSPKEYKGAQEDTLYPYGRVVADEYINWLLIKDSLLKLVQFHPSYTYEDFVRGIVAKTENGNIVYEVEDKIFTQMCRLAAQNPDKNYVLIIDEINRANIPVVFGELVYALEYRDTPVETPYSVNGNRNLVIPKNLYIIGTMNTADRSAGRIDYAIRRRFIFYPLHADINKASLEGKVLMEEVNRFIEENVAPDYDPEDIKIGHTYFIGDKEDIAYKFLYQVVPLLYEYIVDGLLNLDKVENNKGYRISLKGQEYYIKSGVLCRNDGTFISLEDVVTILM